MSEITPNFGALGMDLEQSLKQLKKGKLTYALNAMIEGFDGQYVNYQNEQGNELCVTLPEGYKVIGVYTIYEQNKIIYFLTNPDTRANEIGYSFIEQCEYTPIINAFCLNFNIDYPILSAAHRIGNCNTQIFWVDGYNRDRWLDLDNLPYKEVVVEGACENQFLPEIDCNKLNINPFFGIPTVEVHSVQSDSSLISGTYQFAAQYCNISGEAYTSYYSVSNPLPLFDPNNITLDFNTPVSKSITVDIKGLDNTGFYDYYNLAVIKTINNVSTVQLVGTYKIVRSAESIIYTGQSIKDIVIQDITQTYPLYEKSRDLTYINNILVRDQLTQAPRLTYQEIANQITLEWETYKVTPQFSYADPIVAANNRGYMRDEVYAFEIVFLLNDGRRTDRFHIPGRLPVDTDLDYVYNNDVIDTDENPCVATQPLPRWKVYNTGSVVGNSDKYFLSPTPDCYVGPYEYGQMGYWESTETYPCNPEIWGNLAGQKIRHHKMPDSAVTHIHDNNGNIYPLGIRVNVNQIRQAIENSSLTPQEKSAIVGFKITRANRASNKSVVAKGLIHNVGKYTKANINYFFPNYPYNDLGEDEFISDRSQPYNTNLPEIQTTSCQIYQLVAGASSDTTFQYKTCGDPTTVPALPPSMVSVSVPMGTTLNICTLGDITVTNGVTDATVNYVSECDGSCTGCTSSITPSIPSSPNLQAFAFENETKLRYVFHSPDTHFYQPTLGNILKLETAEYGNSQGHFVQVQDHSRYKLFTSGLYLIAAGAGVAGGVVSAILSLGQQSVDIAIQTYVTVKAVLEKVTPRINYAYQYNSVGNYDKYIPVQNTGNKQRLLDIHTYMIPGYANVGDVLNVNNFQRESSVYLRTTEILPYTHEIGAPADNSRWLPGCDELDDVQTRDISSYYASLKNGKPNQYGQIYSYESVDTGSQFMLATYTEDFATIFGGDVFINKFAYKSKLPYFFDNRVGDLDESDVFYNEIGNIGEPQYWFSMDPTLGGKKFSIFGVPVTKLHCENTNGVIYKRGRMYLFSYGIPYFFCESEVNVDLRQAFNNKEGDFYPHVGAGIPDNWLQEKFVSIAYDNTYYYNRTFSKQNKETFFSFLPPDYIKDQCAVVYPYRAVFSEAGSNDPFVTYSNNWLIYKPSSFFDFPQSFGKLTSLDGMDYNQVLARFENKTQIYNALLTAPTSANEVYLGQPIFSDKTPPIDLAFTDMGYIGSRHKFLLRTEYGIIVVDDKRGHVFLVNGKQAQNLTLQDSGVEQFFNKNLEVQLPKYIPNVPIDNHFNGVGITGVYDAKYDRLIITKIDYIPNVSGIIYENGKFYYNNTEVSLNDTEYFCNKSFTISFDFAVKSWVSFHSYIPSYYVGSSNFFISGQNGQTWKHLIPNKFNSFYGETAPYIVEYPYSFEYLDEILQSVEDYSKTLQYDEEFNFIEVNDVYFNKVILYNNQQCSGILKLDPKPKNNLNQYMKYPIYESDAKTILYTKSDNFYKINQFWSMVKDHKQPIFKKSCKALSFDKELNQANMNYSKMSFNKAPLRAKDLKCRFILDNRTDTRIVSQLLAIETQKSYK